jgi:predicted DNA-binding protein
MTKRTSSLKAALLMPANAFALVAGGVASVAMGDWVPLAAAAGGALSYSVLLSFLPSFRRAVHDNLEAQVTAEVVSAGEREALLADLAPSQRQHYEQLEELKGRILDAYRKMPGGGVLVASSERRLDALLSSFLRLVSTLNSYRKFLNATDRTAIEEELAALELEIASDTNERLKEVKARRVDILKKRVARFVQAEESREVVSHQLASIEDILRLTHEQSIAIRDPEVVSRQLDALTAEVSATEATVREMETFMQVTEDFSTAVSLPGPERVR